MIYRKRIERHLTTILRWNRTRCITERWYRSWKVSDYIACKDSDFISFIFLWKSDSLDWKCTGKVSTSIRKWRFGLGESDGKKGGKAKKRESQWRRKEMKWTNYGEIIIFKLPSFVCLLISRVRTFSTYFSCFFL